MRSAIVFSCEFLAISGPQLIETGGSVVKIYMICVLLTLSVVDAPLA